MSEDRHTFSEPRPIAGLDLPSWDVDVFRDGVPEPIWTLRVDETLLPPRKSKKKKVVWRLPETVDQVPRFGDHEKRRLLDSFKSMKKERRKSKSKQRGSLTGSATGGGDSGDSGGDDDAADTAPDPAVPKQADNAASIATSPATATQQNGTNNTHRQQTSTAATASANPTLGMEHLSVVRQPRESPAPPGLGGAALLQPGISRRHSNPLPPPGLSAATNVRNTIDTNATNLNTDGAAEERRKVAAPPGMSRSQSVPETAPGPPGLAPQPPPQPQQQQQQQLPYQPPPQPQPQPPALTAPGLGPTLTPGLPIPSLLPPARFFTLPPTMPHELFAQQVANLYISLLQTGRVEELLLYYSLTAQKSLSLKSAKSICATPLEMKTQLQSLVGCASFVVQGITVQHTTPPLAHQQANSKDHHYLLLIWSGICQVQGQQHGFCHTLVLTPMASSPALASATEEKPIVPRYQIQNDALVLLANE